LKVIGLEKQGPFLALFVVGDIDFYAPYFFSNFAQFDTPANTKKISYEKSKGRPIEYLINLRSELV